MHQPDTASTTPFERITLNSYSRFGFWTGTMTKQGGFVKSWKVRYFSLTWNHLSYYEENKLFIASIPLIFCNRVETVPTGTDGPWIFNLVTRERTFVFEAATKQDRQQWIEALGAFISIHKVIMEEKNPKNLDEIRKIAFHVFRIINGLKVLNDTHKNLKECTERVSNALIGLLNSYVSQLYDKTDPEKKNKEMLQRCQTMKQAVLLLKQEIPSEYRIDAEEPLFDIGTEQRRINFHLRKLTEESEPDFYPQFYQFDVVEDDIIPFILETFKYALCYPNNDENNIVK